METNLSKASVNSLSEHSKRCIFRCLGLNRLVGTLLLADYIDSLLALVRPLRGKDLFEAPQRCAKIKISGMQRTGRVNLAIRSLLTLKEYLQSSLFIHVFEFA